MRPSRGAWGVAFAAGALLYARAIPAPDLRPDERVYDAAVEAVRGGQPPGQVPGWYYPDSLAVVAAALPEPRWAPLRALDLAGACVTSAVAAEAIGTPLVALLFLLSPPVAAGIAAGNVSGLLTGLVAAAARWPRAATVLLPLGATVKPYALGPALAAGPLVGGLTAGVTLLARLDAPGAGSLSNLDSDPNSAAVRALHQLGLPVPWQVISAAALLAAARFGKGNPARAAALGWLALPIAWDHTALLVLLAAALAWPHAWDLRERLGLVACGAVCSQAHFYALPDGPAWASGLLGLAPSAAALAVAVLARRPR